MQFGLVNPGKVLEFAFLTSPSALLRDHSLRNVASEKRKRSRDPRCLEVLRWASTQPLESVSPHY